jgi:hypothetical protein
MENNIRFKITNKKKSYIIYIYNIKSKCKYNLELKKNFKSEILNYKYIILFLIKLGLINVCI